MALKASFSRGCRSALSAPTSCKGNSIHEPDILWYRDIRLFSYHTANSSFFSVWERSLSQRSANLLIGVLSSSPSLLLFFSTQKLMTHESLVSLHWSADVTSHKLESRARLTKLSTRKDSKSLPLYCISLADKAAYHPPCCLARACWGDKCPARHCRSFVFQGFLIRSPQQTNCPLRSGILAFSSLSSLEVTRWKVVELYVRQCVAGKRGVYT